VFHAGMIIYGPQAYIDIKSIHGGILNWPWYIYSIPVKSTQYVKLKSTSMLPTWP